MKLFIWDNCEAIGEYENGTAFALANNLEEAIESILDKFKLNNKGILTDYTANIYNNLEKELRNTSPDIYESISGFYIYGSA